MARTGQQLRSIVNADGAAVLDIKLNRLVSLNATGGYVWERLVRGCTVDEIIRDLAHGTGVKPATVERDVHAFVSHLIEQGLLET